jgi:soluble lytic murein transglycosylase-like protein
MQLMPRTARALGVNPWDSRDNYRGGAAYLGALMARYGGDLVLSLAAYNAGPGAVERYGGVPPFKETQAYVASVLGRLAAVGSGAAYPGQAIK